MQTNKQSMKRPEAGDFSGKGLLYVLLGAFFWGTLPIFSKFVYANGSDPLTAAAWRSYLAAITFFIWFLMDGTLKKFRKKDLAFYVPLGIVAVGGTFVLYMMAVEVLSTAMAAILLYTAPSFVIILNRLFFRIPITRTKAVALLCTFFGCVVVTKAYDIGMLITNWKGLLLGLASGLCYSLTTVLGVKKDPCFNGRENAGFLVMFSPLAFFMVKPPWNLALPTAPQLLGYLGLAVFGSVLAYVFYMKGLDTGLDGGIASISATIEPVVATIMGVIFFKDSLDLLQIIGIIVVLIGVTLPQIIGHKYNPLPKEA